MAVRAQAKYVRVAPRKARDVVCLSSLKQIGAALAAYEDDHGRLPGHVFELTQDRIEPNQVTVLPAVDLRPPYQGYVDIDFCQCPHLPRFSPATASATYVYVDYDLYAGYFGDYAGGYQNTWSRSTALYRYGGIELNALAGDRLYYESGAAAGRDTIANHATGFENFTTMVYVDASYAYSAAYALVGHDSRRLFTANYVATDGSARTYKGGDPELLALPTRHSVNAGANGTFLVPRRQ